MNVLSVNNVAKSVKDEYLFSSVTFGLDAGEHLGLIGQNGAGKSTFLKLVAGYLEPDIGSVVLNSSCKLAFLQQDVVYSEDCTLSSFLREYKDPDIELLNRYDNADHSVSEKVESMHLWDIETNYRRYLAELGVNKDLGSLMHELSGGEQKKAAIARILAVNPDILLLDEPTNHLDINAIEWLENYLSSAIFTVILVTHDRYFLDSVCSKIMEIDKRKAYFYEGGYTEFVQRRAERIYALQKEQDRLATILRRELEWLKRGPKARTGKDSGRKQRIEDMKGQQTKADEEARDFSSQARRLGKKIVELKNVSIKRGEKIIVKDFSFEFVKGMRIGVVGPNGSGKSTLLDAITGRLDTCSGILDIGINTHFGYYDQKSELLPLNKTPIEYFSDIADVISIDKDYQVTPARFLELFGFPSSFHRLPIGTFSGGEKRRLYLLSQLVQNPNFLVLDEPTNDLDLDTMQRLEQYVMDFPGVVLTVSHDRAFLDHTCDELIIMPEQKRFEGNYSQYHQYQLEQEKAKTVVHNSAKPREHEKKKGLSFKEKQELEAIEQKITELEQEKSDLETWFSSGQIDSDGSKQVRYNQVLGLLDSSYSRWEELSSLL